MISAKFDSLFLRLVRAQVVLLVCTLLLVVGLLRVQRNEMLAPQFAELWAPRIKAMAHDPENIVRADAGRPETLIVRHEASPPGLTLPISAFPAVAIFMAELSRFGVKVDDARLRYTNEHFDMWLLVQVPGAEPVWMSGTVPWALLPVWTYRLTAAMVLLSLVICLFSWNFARRVTNPLAQLRNRMQAHAISGIELPPPAQSMQERKAPPELIEIDQAYRLLAERLHRNERERALLMAGVSHDLRSPLSRIRLAAEMLPESPDNAEGVASITRNVDVADRLTASFLEFVRASTVPMNEVVDLAELIQQVLEGFDRSTDELMIHSPPTLILHGGNVLLIERLIFNLVDNAFKHGGAPVKIELIEQGAWATLVVSDAGPGLPENGADQLVEAFARGDASRGSPGFGLGLAIVQQVVVRLHGNLSFGQHLNRHQVTVRLPLRLSSTLGTDMQISHVKVSARVRRYFP
ncbi:ATP-binding protein [Curvibacter sp. HBC28]|uniref:histidine kinase n=1 Tax=Curvibacter microcysteis TaxID=3026419 RepID=A0ABT5MDU6_9BURK|nr:ATP-binding protein [Curvibacter sp. HBC28]MDD0813286.1 ATP-binding protein [Curvibacter sp. HBC28]